MSRCGQNDRINHLARRMLEALACLAPGAPIELTWLKPLWEQETAEMRGVALNRLLALGLVARPEPGQVKLHRLVTQFLQGEKEPETQQQLWVQVGQLMNKKAEEINATELPSFFYPLFPHILRLAEKTESYDIDLANKLWNELSSYSLNLRNIFLKEKANLISNNNEHIKQVISPIRKKV